MTKEFTILIFGLIGILLTSCDPAIGVAIENRSKSDKQIIVIYPQDFKFPGDHEYSFGVRDSIKTYDLTIKDSYLKPTMVAKVDWDTVSSGYQSEFPALKFQITFWSKPWRAYTLGSCTTTHELDEKRKKH